MIYKGVRIRYRTMAKGTSRRQANGAAFFPQWIWEWVNTADGEEIEFQDEVRKDGKHYVTYWKKGE
jgi:hypothetical protein